MSDEPRTNAHSSLPWFGWIAGIASIVVMFPCGLAFWGLTVSDVGQSEQTFGMVMAIAVPLLAIMNVVILWIVAQRRLDESAELTAHTRRVRRVLSISHGVLSIAALGYLLLHHDVWRGGEGLLVLLLFTSIQAGVMASIVLHRGPNTSQRNLCQSCDYDRQGLPPDHPCPECGAHPEPPAE